MFATLLRVLFGFLAACLAVGFVQVAFVMPPAEILAMPDNVMSDRLAEAGMLTLVAATQSAVFAAPFALVAAAIAEWQAIRGWIFHAFVGLVICGVGMASLYLAAGDSEPTIANFYAGSAFGLAGIIGGTIYWLFAGRFSGDTTEEYEYSAPVITAPRTVSRPTAAVPAARSTPTPAAPPPSPSVGGNAPRKA